MLKDVFCLILEFVITAYFHINCGNIYSFASNKFIFRGISTAVFRVSNSSDAYD